MDAPAPRSAPRSRGGGGAFAGCRRVRFLRGALGRRAGGPRGAGRAGGAEKAAGHVGRSLGRRRGGGLDAGRHPIASPGSRRGLLVGRRRESGPWNGRHGTRCRACARVDRREGEQSSRPGDAGREPRGHGECGSRRVRCGCFCTVERRPSASRRGRAGSRRAKGSTDVDGRGGQSSRAAGSR